jgi:hypothetical protein
MSIESICVKFSLLVLFSLNFYPVTAQIEEGRPIVILMTPDTTYAGSLDDDLPRYETPAMEGLYDNKKGLITNGNALELVLLNIFYNGMPVTPEAQMVILAIPSGNTRDAWLRIAAILFDRFHVPSLYIHEADNWDDAITPELTPGDKLYWISNSQDG